MAEISFQISAAPSITNDLIAVIYNTTAPGAEIARIVDSTDHSSPASFQFSNLDPGVYIVKVHESPDGVALGNLRHDFWVDAVTNQQVTIEDRWYTVDGLADHDPVSEQNEIPDSYLDGRTVLLVYKEGFRPLEPVTEWTPIVGGGVELLLTIPLSPGEKVLVQLAVPVSLGSTITNDSFSQFVTFTGNVTLTSTEYNKTVLIQSAANKQTTTLPLIASVADSRGYLIRHDGANAVNVIVKAQTGEVIRFRGADINQVELGKGEFIKVIKNGSKWIVNDDRGQWDRLGEVIHARIGGDNMLLMDGVTEYDLTVYVRLKRFIDSLPVGQVVDYAAFADVENKGFFAVDSVNNKAKLPMMFDMSLRFLKSNGGADPDRPDNIPGGYQAGMVGNHTATVTGKKGAMAGGNGGSANAVLLKNTMVPPFNVGGASEDVAGIAIVTGKETVSKNYGYLPFLLI
jgi:hypothetical protein